MYGTRWKTQPELGRQSGPNPRFGVPIVRDRWIGRLIDAYQVKAPLTDFVLRQPATMPSRSSWSSACSGWLIQLQ